MRSVVLGVVGMHGGLSGVVGTSAIVGPEVAVREAGRHGGGCSCSGDDGSRRSTGRRGVGGEALPSGSPVTCVGTAGFEPTNP